MIADWLMRTKGTMRALAGAMPRVLAVASALTFVLAATAVASSCARHSAEAATVNEAAIIAEATTATEVATASEEATSSIEASTASTASTATEASTASTTNMAPTTSAGDAPGQPGDTTGQPGDAPGQPGDDDGQPGNAPGQPGDNAGQPGDATGQPGDNDGQPGDNEVQRRRNERPRSSTMAEHADGGAVGTAGNGFSANSACDAIFAAVDTPEMYAESEDVILDVYGIPKEDYRDAAIYVCEDGLIADEFVIVVAVDSAAAKRIEEHLKNYMSNRAEVALLYSIEQYAMIQEGIVRRDGLVVVLLVTPDIQDATKAFNAYLKTVGSASPAD